MKINCATANDNDIDNSYNSGIRVGEIILDQIKLQNNSVGILFCHIDYEIEDLISGIKSKLDIPLIGCTTNAIISESGYEEEAVTLMVITSDQISFGFGLGENLSEKPEKSVKTAYEMASSNLSEKPKLAIVLPDSAMSGTTSVVLDSLESVLGNIPVAGGLPGDDDAFEKAYQIYDSKVYTNSIPILLISGDIDPVVITRSGWVPISPLAKVTKVKGPVLLEINNKPAIEYYHEFIEDVDEPGILGGFPIAIKDKSLGKDADNLFEIRSAFFVDKETGGVVCGGFIPLNSEIYIAKGSREQIIEGAQTAALELTKQTGGKQLNVIFVFSCSGRKMYLGLDVEKEVEMLQNSLLSDIPLHGFYSFGEIGAFNSKNSFLDSTRFHNTTLVLCAF